MRAPDHYLYKDAMGEASRIRELERTVAFLSRALVRWEATQFPTFVVKDGGRLETVRQEEPVVALKVREEIQRWQAEIVERQYRLDDLLRRIERDIDVSPG